MKIVDVSAYTCRQRIQHPYVWRRGLLGSGEEAEHTVIRISTDEGVEGVAVVGRGAIVADLVRRRLRPMLVGRDPLLREQLWHEVWELDRIEELPIYMLGAVDVALWDLLGRLTARPVYELAGGAWRQVPCYASTVTYRDVPQYLRIADRCLEAGFRAIKLHAWGEVRRDAELAHALRRHVGDEVTLLYDGSAGFDLVDALRLGHELEDAGFLWYEEPMREFSIHAYARLCAALDIPVLAAETSDGVHFNAADFIHYDAADMIRTSTHFKGGMTGALRVAHLAEAHHLRAEVHGGGLTNLHLACAIPNNSYFEVLVMDEPAVFAEEVDGDGTIAPPEGPGFGFDFDWKALAEEAVVVA